MGVIVMSEKVRIRLEFLGWKEQSEASMFMAAEAIHQR